MGKRYTEEEKSHIQELADQGHTDESIAQQLGRSTNAVRNYRHRTNIKTKQTKTIQQLNQENHDLTRQTQEILKQLRQLEAKRDKVKRGTCSSSSCHVRCKAVRRTQRTDSGCPFQC